MRDGSEEGRKGGERKGNKGDGAYGGYRGYRDGKGKGEDVNEREEKGKG